MCRRPSVTSRSPSAARLERNRLRTARHRTRLPGLEHFGPGPAVRAPAPWPGEPPHNGTVPRGTGATPRMGLLAQQGIPPRGVPLVMQPRNTSDAPAHNGTIDGATLYLCRQGPRWVVVIESPTRHRRRAAPSRRSLTATMLGSSSCRASRARPAPTPPSSVPTGPSTSEDYEWRIEVRGIVALAPVIWGGAAPRTHGRGVPTTASPRADGRAPLPLGPEPVVLGPSPRLLIRSGSTAQPAPSGWRALHAGAVHLAAHARVVVQRVVHGAAVVPDGERPGGPAQPAGEVLVDAVPVRDGPAGPPTPPSSSPRSGSCTRG